MGPGAEARQLATDLPPDIAVLPGEVELLTAHLAVWVQELFASGGVRDEAVEKGLEG